jgi:hypothetical protein
LNCLILAIIVLDMTTRIGFKGFGLR